MLSATGAAASARSTDPRCRGAPGIEAPALPAKSLQHIDVFSVPGNRRPRRRHQGHRRTIGRGRARADRPVHLVSCPDIDYKIAWPTPAPTSTSSSEWEMSAKGLSPEFGWRTAKVVPNGNTKPRWPNITGCSTRRPRLEVVTTPIAGKVVDIDDGLLPGMWVKAKSRLASVIDPRRGHGRSFLCR